MAIDDIGCILAGAAEVALTSLLTSSSDVSDVNENMENLALLSTKEYSETIILDTKTKLFSEPKKSIHYLNLKKDQKITIFGHITIDGIKWNKAETENGDKGWCILP